MINKMIAKQNDKTFYKNSVTGKLVLILTILACILWFVGRSIDVYQYAVTGVIFEMIWLPILASFIAVPIIALIHFRKQGFHLNSLYLYSLIVIAITVSITLIQ